MGFLMQLKLLLWKNFTVKKRRPWVLVFELFIPLVLFVILLAIRKKLPLHEAKASQHHAKALPSAGIVGILQAFCDGHDGVHDEQGFINYPNSTVREFLEEFDIVAHNNNFFEPDFSPEDLDKLPSLYHSILEDPAAVHQQLQGAQNFELEDVFTDQQGLHDSLVTNFPLNDSEVDTLFTATVNVTHVFTLLSKHADKINENRAKDAPLSRQRRDTGSHESQDNPFRSHDMPALPHDWQTDDSGESRENNHEDSPLYENIHDTLRDGINHYNSQHADHPIDVQNITIPHGQNYSQYQGLMTDPRVLKYSDSLAALNTEERTMLFNTLVNHPEYMRDPAMRDIILAMVIGDQSDVSPVDLVTVLEVVVFDPYNMHEMICVDHELPNLLIPAPNATSSMTDIEHSLCNMTSQQWQDLSVLFMSHTNATEIVIRLDMNDWNATVAQDRLSEFILNFHAYIVFQNNLDHLSLFAMTLPHDSCMDSILEKNSTSNFTITTTNPMDLDTEGTPVKVEPKDEKKPKHSKYEGLLRIWIAIQSTVCGKPAISQDKIDKFMKTTKMKDLGLTQNQRYDLKLLLHVLYSNPKVLYSPNNTQADQVIEKANATFQLFDSVTIYARKWLNVSQSLRLYLNKNTTQANIEFIQQMTLLIRQNDEVVEALSARDNVIGQFLHNGTMHNRDELLAEIDVVDNAACSWLSLTKGISFNVFQGFNTEDDVVRYFLNDAYSDNVTVLASVVFTNMNDDGSLPPHVVYKIRQNTSLTHDTRRIRPPFWSPGPNSWSYNYYNFGFVWIQDVIERAIIDLFAGRGVLEPGSYLKQFPYPCYIQDRFLFMIEHVMPLCLTFSWVYTVAMLVRNIVYEKEQRLKEVMKIMGLSNSVHWVAWFITTFAQMTITMITLTCMLRWGNVLPNSNPWLIFIVLEVFAVATISFSFLVSVFYSKAKLASAFAGILYFLTYVPYMYIAIREEAAFDQIPAWAKTIASLFSTTAFGLGAKYFAFYEIEDIGVQWSNIYFSPVENDQYNLFLVVLMMMVDSAIYCVLTWYIENIHPGSYGLPKPWYFPFTQSYWCGHSYSSDRHCLFNAFKCLQRRSGLSVTEEDQACAMDDVNVEEGNFENDPTNLALGVCIENLTKRYKTGKLAVNRLNLKLYQDQITSFLGHNGAGKTTTMSILTGLFPPTSGYATIYGKDIRTDMEDIRQSVGMCPQHNVLFDNLTVEEHLWFYACLKGCAKNMLKQEMDRMIEDTGLTKKRHSVVDSLSGGMKRKLSVAIAFVSGSRTVILDEPTAGVDPYARRAIWDLLLKYKEGRTILLSTHHMDEADLLGDRIAIISNGQLKCCGSSLFLKNTYGEGYHLTVVKKPSEEDLKSIETLSQDDFNPNSTAVSFHTQCCISNVTKFIQHYVPTAYIKSFTNQEIQYILPFAEVKQGNFQTLFSALDSRLEELEISSYGLVDTNLEEVFLKVTEQHINDIEEDKEQKDDQRLIENLTPSIQSQSSLNDMNAANTHAGNEEDTQLLNDLYAGYDDNVDEHAALLDPGYTTYDNHQSETDTNTPNPPRLSGTTAFRLREFTRGHNRTPSGSSQISLGSFDGLTDMPSSPTHHQSSRLGNAERNYLRLQNEEASSTNNTNNDTHNVAAEGRGGTKTQGWTLIMQQFFAIIIKRFVYIRRNWKGLFSQIILPALFVCIAMTVALTAPRIEDFPPIVLSPAQFFNHTQPRGNFIATSNLHRYTKTNWTLDATPEDILHTFKLASGAAATCVLRSPFNSSFDEDLLRHLNFTYRNFNLLAKYFEPECESVFRHDIPLDNFVPPIPVPETPTVNPNVNLTQFMSTTPIPHARRYYPSCHCSEQGRGFVCSSANYQDPPSFRAVTSDIILDVTSSDNEDDYFLYTTDMYRLHRYGAISVGNSRDYVPEDFGKNAPDLFRKIAVRNAAKVYYNHKGFHAMPVYLNTLNNAILRANLPKSAGNPAAYGITLINHPMNNTNEMDVMTYVYQGSDVLIAMFIIIAMSFVPASFVLFLVHERSIKAKHLQFVSGINPVVYWMANLIWDMCNYMVPAICCILILRIFNIPAYCSPTNTPAVIGLFILYGWSMTPLMYPASFFFHEPSTAYIFFIVVNLFVGITCILTSFLLEIFQFSDKDLAHTHEQLKTIFLIFPNYCLGRGLMDIAFNEYQNQYYFKTGLYDKMKSPFEWKLTSRNLVTMAIMGFIFFIITLLCEYKFFIKKKKISSNSMTSPVDEDVDVAVERRRVLRGSGKRDLIRLENLTQIYKTSMLGRHLAVDRLSLGIPQGECFGLLGVNGAGKTTTFKMLTGDLPATGGDAHLSGFSINKNINEIRQSIGYCPQFDALYDELTAREHLYLYCRLRGIPYSEQSKVVEWAIRELGITQYADKLSGTYSGGNKRKLSTAIALIGHPPVIFLDEPTTGMDPHSRRFLWDLILGLIRQGRSIILTSHSMEECEVLCSRLAIMVNGHFKCLGSIQHLKNRFGEGYTLLIRVRGPNFPREMARVTNFVQRHFPMASLKDSHHNMLKFELSSEGLSLANLFTRMEQAQNDSGLKLEDYSISQNNLDNVFINFVKQQMEINPNVDLSSTSQSSAENSTTSQNTTPEGAGANIELMASSGDDVPLLTDVHRYENELESDDDALNTDLLDNAKISLMTLDVNI